MECADPPQQPCAEAAAFDGIPDEALHATKSEILRQGGSDMLARWDLHQAWWEARQRQGMAPEEGARPGALDFVSQDHLNLATHPAVQAAARLAMERFGLVGAEGEALRELEQRVARFLGYADCTLLPSGLAARQAVIAALAGPGDHVLLDEAVTAGLRAGAGGSGAATHGFAHLSNEAALRQLARLRAAAPEAGILVATESLFAHDSAAPDLPGLQALCRQYRATLLVDVTQDLGVLGSDGRGHLAAQGMLGLADIVTGGFCRGFGSPGGFVAARTPSLRLGLRPRGALPLQAAIVLAAFDMVVSFEGAARRERVLRQAVLLRDGLQAAGFTVLGEPSPMVPVLLGPPALARLMTRHAREGGARLELVEPPDVAAQACRWVLQLRADHTPAQMRRMVGIAREAREMALAHARALGLSLESGAGEAPPQPSSA
jgi:glycine C-acetyltransferase